MFAMLAMKENSVSLTHFAHMSEPIFPIYHRVCFPFIEAAAAR